jgi:hypothetical protein
MKAIIVAIISYVVSSVDFDAKLAEEIYEYT